MSCVLALSLVLSAVAGGQGVRSPAAGRVLTDTLWSQALGTTKQLVVWLPPSYDREPGRSYPVAYYLHGAWGGEWDWVRAGKIDQVLDSLVAGGMREMIVVMPDGDDGFYTTWNALGNYADCTAHPPARESAATYCVPWPHYDDYIARDLVAHVDSNYRTLRDARHRAIAGLSMGGYGAISLALGYPDVFSAAASHSGVVSPTYIGPKPFGGTARYATTEAQFRDAYPASFLPLLALPFGRDTAAWVARDPARMAERLAARDRARMPALMLDCGTEDGLIDQNRALHAALDRLGIAHSYAEWPGAHTWSYWHQHVGESLRWIASRMGT